MVADAPTLEVSGLTIRADTANGPIVPLEGFDLVIMPGEIVGLVGESGSGKTTAVRSFVGSLSRNCHVAAGSINFRGVEVITPEKSDLKGLRGREIGVILQNAMGSLNPVLKVRTQIREMLRARPDISGEAKEKWSHRILERMGFENPRRILHSYPHQLSGGMAQRVAIAIAMSCEPSLLIADECTTALDVTLQAEVIKLLREMTRLNRTSLLFVTHDLALASELCSSVVVLYAGKVMEAGETSRVLGQSRHPYTRALLNAVPVWGAKKKLSGIGGMAPTVTSDFRGCRFASRCPFVIEECRGGEIFWEGEPGHGYRCIRANELAGPLEQARSKLCPVPIPAVELPGNVRPEA